MKTKPQTDFNEMFEWYKYVYCIHGNPQSFTDLPVLDLKEFIRYCSFVPQGKTAPEIFQEMKERELLNGVEEYKIEFLEKEFSND